MPKLNECLVGKADLNLVNSAKAKALAQRYLDEVDDLMQSDNIPRAEAERLATENFVKDIEREKLRKKRMALIHAAKQQQILADIEAGRARGVSAEDTALAYMAHDYKERTAGIPSLATHIPVVRGQIHSILRDFMDEYRSKMAGLKRGHRAGVRDVVKELYDQDTGNKGAKGFAQAIKKAQDYSRARYNAAGGDVLAREDYGLPIVHSQGTVASVARDEWVSYVSGLIDPKRMLNANGRPLSPGQLKTALNHSYDSITTGGLSDKGDSFAKTTQYGSSINARAESRFLAFKDADSWINYHEKFGEGDLYEHITGTFDRLAKDIAELEILGPHPEAAVRVMEGQIDTDLSNIARKSSGKAGKKAAEQVGKPKRKLRTLHSTVLGRTSLTADSGVSSLLQGNRNLLTAATLGSAYWSALADMGTLARTARLNGMPAMRTMGAMLKMFSPTSHADRKMAIQLGFTAQGWADKAIGAQRVLGESMGAGWTETATDTVLRAGWLSPWTEAGRWAFQTEMLGHLTRNAEVPFNQLDPIIKQSFARGGIDAKTWDIIRNSQRFVDDKTGAEFLTAENVADGALSGPTFDAANKMQHAIFNETQAAIVSAIPQARAFLIRGTQAGTLEGEAFRNIAMFKGFLVSFHMIHFNRMMAQSNFKTKAQYGAGLVIALTGIGALAEQLANISVGKSPAKMDDSEEGRNFWMKSAMRGGAFGMVGDLALNDVNKFGGGIVQFLAGPAFSQADDLAKLTIGNIHQISKGENTNFGREMTNFVQKNMPGQSLWWGRTALERLVFDQIQDQVDPGARKSFRRMESLTKERFGNEHYWRPGEALPDFAQ